MEKIDATFAKDFGFELEDHGTWFALYTTSDPIIKGDVINGKARNVVLSYEGPCQTSLIHSHLILPWHMLIVSPSQLSLRKPRKG